MLARHFGYRAKYEHCNVPVCINYKLITFLHVPGATSWRRLPGWGFNGRYIACYAEPACIIVMAK